MYVTSTRIKKTQINTLEMQMVRNRDINCSETINTLAM
jgi:hypothetical protein